MNNFKNLNENQNLKKIKKLTNLVATKFATRVPLRTVAIPLATGITLSSESCKSTCNSRHVVV
jgi:hypothetical protein